MATSAEGPKGATPITEAQNRAVLDALPFGDTQDFEDAHRGFLGSLPEVEIKNGQGRVVWSLREYAFLAGEEAPPTVNPSLWRQAGSICTTACSRSRTASTRCAASTSRT
jgi:alkyl sulfatase BDS1-like metallo-beta-lactamase superfamily hydrolase